MHLNIGNLEFLTLMKEQNVVVLDVRTPKETAEGHIPGATFLDIKDPGFTANLSNLDKDKTYLLYCRSGNRSAIACIIMAEKGFRVPLYNLAKGFSEWTGEVKK